MLREVCQILWVLVILRVIHLMQPEVAHYLIRATQELADILGISMQEVR
jgi:hypothetical protein